MRYTESIKLLEKMMHYLITGGTGFIGTHLIQQLLAEGHTITVLSRKPKIAQAPYSVIQNLEEVPAETRIDCIINLAGKPIDCRWTAAAKKSLTASRIDTTAKLIKLIARLKEKPDLLISASAIGYYGNDHSERVNENTEPHPSFTQELCQRWEEEALKAEQHGVRACIARFGVVLGSQGGFIKKTYWPFKLGLGGKLGNGKQIFSWIHLDDLLRGLQYFIKNPQARGAYNFVAPDLVTNETLTRTLGDALKRPTIFHVNETILKLLGGEMAENLLLKGNNIIPEKLLAEDFEFHYTELKKAIEDSIIQKKPL